MFNPLNEKISLLLQEIAKLEAERDQTEKPIRDLYPLSNQRPEIITSVKPRLEVVERLNQTIDSKRQELIAAELLMLDNSIKELRSTTGQVNDSMKSLNTTTDKMLKSSTKLEGLTLILNYITLMLVIIAIYQVVLVLGQSNPLYGVIGIWADFLALIYFMIRVVQDIRSGRIIPLKGKRTTQ